MVVYLNTHIYIYCIYVTLTETAAEGRNFQTDSTRIHKSLWVGWALKNFARDRWGSDVSRGWNYLFYVGGVSLFLGNKIPLSQYLILRRLHGRLLFWGASIGGKGRTRAHTGEVKAWKNHLAKQGSAPSVEEKSLHLSSDDNTKPMLYFNVVTCILFEPWLVFTINNPFKLNLTACVLLLSFQYGHPFENSLLPSIGEVFLFPAA